MRIEGPLRLRAADLRLGANGWAKERRQHHHTSFFLGKERSMVDYRPMWAELDLDLEKHDLLLQALPAMYESIFLGQESRPEAMGYFDFVVSEIHGLRVRELMDHKASGGKVVGLYCVFVPEDLIMAADAIAVGLCAGTQFSVPDAEEVLPRNTCALIKASFGFKVGRTCPYLQASDFVVGETTCDGKKKMYEILGEYHPTYVMEVPQKKTPLGRALFLEELRGLKAKLEAETGVVITAEKLANATALVEAKRRALQRLHSARRARPVPISGLDALLVTQIAFYDDPVRYTEKVNALCEELEGRIARGEGTCPPDAPRILVSGSPMAIPNWKLHRILEDSGAVVVGEESCTGTRYFSDLAAESDGSLEGQLEAIADRQLETHCACFTPNDERIGDIIELARGWAVDGVVHYNLQFCHTFANEAVKVERALAGKNIPLLRIETDYNDEDGGQLKNRVDAFLEMIGR
jgi:benzoyl-CoA reductase/2-hydroxyglutaryl-CoA dehydratase subunit BcrC/BadD/HgdB